jgi:hypothetical protein
MRKLKLAIILPIIQVLVATVLLLQADRTRGPGGVDYHFFPPAWLICKGLNAPAMLLLVPFGGTWYFVPPIPIVGRALFLISVAAVWYFVGRVLDERRAPSQAREHRVAITLILRFLLLVAGGILFYGGWNEFGAPISTLVGLLLTFIWALSLIVFSSVSLLRLLRDRHRHRPPPS